MITLIYSLFSFSAGSTKAGLKESRNLKTTLVDPVLLNTSKICFALKTVGYATLLRVDGNIIFQYLDKFDLGFEWQFVATILRFLIFVLVLWNLLLF